MNNFNKILIGTLVILLLVSLLLFFYHNKTSPTGAVVSERENIVIAQGISPKTSPLIIAEEKGFFTEEGLDIEVKKFSAGRLALDALLSKDAQFAEVATIPIMGAGFNKQKIVVIATTTKTDNDIKVVARKDKGISKPQDLRNKKIAAFLGTSGEVFTREFLKLNGLNSNDVSIINLRPQEMPTALERGDIDAYIIWEPFVYNGAKLLGDKAIVFSNDKVYRTTFNIVVNKDFAASNPSTLKKFLRALINAEKFIQENREESVKIVAKSVDMDSSVLNKIWNDYDFKVSLDRSLITILEKDAEWALDIGTFSKTEIPNFRDMIYDNPLKEIMPKSVTI